ncbi:MAG TPA: DUF2298 domain-containing protein [Longilinea sp.]|nr:DUF2298 domain-containing protein [Longilinea sp.]
MTDLSDIKPVKVRKPFSDRSLIWDALLIVVLISSLYFRLLGSDWALQYHLHPDERFLSLVQGSISPVHSLSEYFDTETSPLNPANRGYGFFVYGTLPLFLVQYVGQWVGQAGYTEVTLVGRIISGIADTLTVLLVYLIGNRLFKKASLSLLAAAFYGFAVLPIQLSHYMTVECVTNFFGFLTFYFAIHIQTQPVEKDLNPQHGEWDWLTKHWKTFTPYALFGLALGLATASKINAVFLCLLAPLAAFLNFWSHKEEDRNHIIWTFFRNLVLAAIIAFVTFRIFQPYAFEGPSFFNFRLSDGWVDSLMSQSALSEPSTGYPPSVQWIDRPVTFALTNMVEYGFGLPLGILAVAGFLWMGWRMWKRGEWTKYLPLWGWTLFYFLWQGLLPNPTMRYEMLVYPTFCLIAAWAVFALWDKGVEWVNELRRKVGLWTKIVSAVVGITVLTSTFLWAFAFTRIYARPITRIAASEWIYQNVPSSVNLEMDIEGEQVQQPLNYPQGNTISSIQPITLVFSSDIAGALTSFEFTHVRDLTTPGMTRTLQVTVADFSDPGTILTSGSLISDFSTLSTNDPRGDAYSLPLTVPIMIEADHNYVLTLSVAESDSALTYTGPFLASVLTETYNWQIPLLEPIGVIRPEAGLAINFTPREAGTLTSVLLNRVVDWEQQPGEKTLRISIYDESQIDQPLTTQEVSGEFLPTDDLRGDAVSVVLTNPIVLDPNRNYVIRFDVVSGSGAIGIYGNRQTVESSWDDPLPYSMSQLEPYDYNRGVYRSDLNLEMYWPDNADKLERILETLSQADYLFISSSRQWGSVGRLDSDYPLSVAFYRALLGCPSDQEITYCYSVAQPGTYSGLLGFELVYVNQSNPSIGSFEINTQFAEEAFTVYDHPKVLIFRRTADFDPQQVLALLSPYLSASAYGDANTGPSSTLLIPSDRAEEQASGGTWSEMFSYDDLVNKYPGLGVVVWYLAITLLGLIVYPIIRLAFRGLPDKGYPLSRLGGLLLLALIVWLAGSAGIPFVRWTILAAIGLLLIVGLGLGWLQRDELKEEWKTRKKYFLTVEIVALAFFTYFLLIRLGNSDLWHPSKGGEKPMDFSYLNAVLRSTTFPPYDPWFAGGYINYYYYGFVICAVPIKLLGVVPSIAYNFVLPTFFMFFALGAFTLGSNLITAAAPLFSYKNDDGSEGKSQWKKLPVIGGVAAAVMTLVLGNLGTVRMIWQGLERLGSAGTDIATGNFFQHIQWAALGIGSFFRGNPLPYTYGDWYWIPSRVIPGEPITEFPSFTFLYADPHAHLFAMPITLMVLALALSVLLQKWQWGGEQRKLGGLAWASTLLISGVIIGALRPTNTWDFPTYLLFFVIAVLYTGLRYSHASVPFWKSAPAWVGRVIKAVGMAGLVVIVSIGLYQPYSYWYAAGYTSASWWEGATTPMGSYITQWGMFLFILITWLVQESIDWMATTPASHLKKLEPYKNWIYMAAVLVVFGIAALLIIGVGIAWLVGLLLVWSAVLILRPGQPDGKRFTLFMIGTGLALTLFVELVVISGDLGRMNTVYKFYVQAWILLGISSAAALMWLLPAVMQSWKMRWSSVWQVALALLIGGTALFSIIASVDKVRDRISLVAPHTLDGMTYMLTAHYSDFGDDMDLSEDYRAIRWMQENVQGSPVIVEANCPEYRWCSRYTIYTGLPGVVGWNWHQRQQRGVVSTIPVEDRVAQIQTFYTTEDRGYVENFLTQYQVRYIIVGQLERAEYAIPADNIFEAWNGELWTEVYRDGDTVIYEVLP